MHFTYFNLTQGTYYLGGCRGCDLMVVGFSTTCAIGSNHHSSCEFKPHLSEVYSIQHYVIKFVGDLWQVGSFLCILVSSTNETDITEILL
jgi:hypothetical protein